jgi:hypothetical protein
MRDEERLEMERLARRPAGKAGKKEAGDACVFFYFLFFFQSGYLAFRLVYGRVSTCSSLPSCFLYTCSLPSCGSKALPEQAGNKLDQMK